MGDIYQSVNNTVAEKAAKSEPVPRQGNLSLKGSTALIPTTLIPPAVVPTTVYQDEIRGTIINPPLMDNLDKLPAKLSGERANATSFLAGGIIGGGEPSAVSYESYLMEADNGTAPNSSSILKIVTEFPWPVKKEAVVEGDIVLGMLLMLVRN